MTTDVTAREVTTNWTNLVSSNKNVVKSFAKGTTTAQNFYNAFKGTSLGGEVRSLLRNRGHLYARRLARKALRRRGVSV